MKLVSMAEHEQLRGLWPQSYEFFFKYSLFSPLKMQKADILNLFCSKTEKIYYISDLNKYKEIKAFFDEQMKGTKASSISEWLHKPFMVTKKSEASNISVGAPFIINMYA